MDDKSKIITILVAVGLVVIVFVGLNIHFDKYRTVYTCKDCGWSGDGNSRITESEREYIYGYAYDYCWHCDYNPITEETDYHYGYGYGLCWHWETTYHYHYPECNSENFEVTKYKIEE